MKNVVTHTAFRGKDEKTLAFYRNAGYNSNDKTAFIQWLDG